MALDLTSVKIRLSISDTLRDLEIEMLIEQVEAYIKQFCNDDFGTGMPVDLELAATSMIGFHLNEQHGIASKSVGDASEVYLTDYPENIKKALKIHKKAKFV